MARSRILRPTRHNRDAERLIALATALSASGSRVEDRFWERQIEAVLAKLLRSGQDNALEIALDHLLVANANAYEVLIELCETQSESIVMEMDGQRYEVLLVVAPLAAWTRYQIPAGKIRPDALEALQAQLHGHVLAPNVRLALAPALLAIDQMPRTFSATQQWLLRLGAQALDKPTTQKFSLPDAEDVPGMLADTRYLVGAIAVPEGEAMFRWQESLDASHSRAQCLEQWARQSEPTFAALLPGCGLEILLPDAWYVANRDADRRVRPLAIRAAITWLETALDTTPDQLRAVVAGCGEQQIDEYRIGFTQRNSNDVVYGCVWPLFGREGADDPVDETEQGTPLDTVDQIVDLLRSNGITEIRRLPGLLPPDFCEDCGAPYFPDPTGEMVHAEMPEDAEFTPPQFH
ncbi:MAG: DUF2863 family protein [Pigmentiphaga sp.]|nr:DUF2863 family protein [Pigmentiphaga sp.]